MVMTAWISLGIFLVVKSDLKSCVHDSLWAMSIIFMVIIGVWIVVQGVYTLIKSITCTCIEPEPEFDDLWRQWRLQPNLTPVMETSVILDDDDLFISDH
jgi:hypothetical protein